MNPVNKTIMALTLSLGAVATVVAGPTKEVNISLASVAAQYGHRDHDYGLQGAYSGYNSLYRAEIHLTIRRNGHINVWIKPDRGRQVHQKGFLGGDGLTIDGNRYRIERSERDGDFTIVQENDRENRIQFHPDR